MNRSRPGDSRSRACYPHDFLIYWQRPVAPRTALRLVRNGRERQYGSSRWSLRQLLISFERCRQPIAHNALLLHPTLLLAISPLVTGDGGGPFKPRPRWFASPCVTLTSMQLWRRKMMRSKLSRGCRCAATVELVTVAQGRVAGLESELEKAKSAGQKVPVVTLI